MKNFAFLLALSAFVLSLFTATTAFGQTGDSVVKPFWLTMETFDTIPWVESSPEIMVEPERFELQQRSKKSSAVWMATPSYNKGVFGDAQVEISYNPATNLGYVGFTDFTVLERADGSVVIRSLGRLNRNSGVFHDIIVAMDGTTSFRVNNPGDYTCPDWMHHGESFGALPVGKDGARLSLVSWKNPSIDKTHGEILVWEMEVYFAHPTKEGKTIKRTLNFWRGAPHKMGCVTNKLLSSTTVYYTVFEEDGQTVLRFLLGEGVKRYAHDVIVTP